MFVLQIFLAGIGFIIGTVVIVMAVGFLQLLYMLRGLKPVVKHLWFIPYAVGGYATWWAYQNPPPWHFLSPNPDLLEQGLKSLLVLLGFACMLVFFFKTGMFIGNIYKYIGGIKSKALQARVDTFRN